MSIRLDPRRVNALKHLAGEAGVRPGDLVRQWVEERIDASRTGGDVAPSAPGGREPAQPPRGAHRAGRGARVDERPAPRPHPIAAPTEPPAAIEEPRRRARGKKRASAAPSAKRVALHDEMIAIIRERGPMRAGELADAIVERGRYTVPRSGKPLDAKTVQPARQQPDVPVALRAQRGTHRPGRGSRGSQLGPRGSSRPRIGQSSRTNVTRMLAWNSSAPSRFTITRCSLTHALRTPRRVLLARSIPCRIASSKLVGRGAGQLGHPGDGHCESSFGDGAISAPTANACSS